MPSLSFQKQFAPGIHAMLDKDYRKRTGIKAKTTTIRAKRKNPIHKGDVLYLFVGQRTKYCQRLGKVICKKIEEIVIDETRDSILINVNGIRLNYEEAQILAEDDGFEGVKQMVKWFSRVYKLPFTGDRIHFTTTYDRKYFMNKKVKDRGFKLNLEQTAKTILINQEDYESAKSDKYVQELATKHNYGVQILNPLFK